MPIEDVLFMHIAKTGGTSLVDIFGLRAVANTLVTEGRVYFYHKTVPIVRNFCLMDTLWFNRAFKFTFVRNPYERAVSHYHWCKKNNKWDVGPRTTFLDYCHTSMKTYRHHGPQVMYFEAIEFDFVGRFENFNEDVLKLAEMLGDPEPTIKHLNKSDRPRDFRETYCPESKKIVEDFYAEDFERLNYQLESF